MKVNIRDLLQCHDRGWFKDGDMDPRSEPTLPSEGLSVCQYSGLTRLRLQQEDELRRRRKVHRMKADIPRRLQQETIMTLQWITDRLKMRTWTHVANRPYHLKN